MTTIYIVTSEDGSIAHATPTKKAAKEYKSAQYNRGQGKIEEVQLAELPRRDLLCAMFNRTGFRKPKQKLLKKA